MIRLVHRSLLVLRGADATPLMQGLITNDVRVLEAGKPVAAFLLNIKGRIVEDLILWQRNQDLLIECSTKTRDDLKKTLEKYRMRKKVDIIASDEPVSFSTESGDFQDPRLSSLGFRSFGKDGNENVDTYHRRRRELGIAEGSEEIAGLLPFQCNGDILNMISLDKGCYIGQELTARTAHTGVIRKRIIPFNYDSNDELDNIVVDENKKKAGQIISYHDGVGLALLSVNSINMNLFSKTTQIQQFRPSWMSSKHLRRLLEEKEQEKYCKPEEESSEVEDEGPPPQMNRFAFLEDDSESEKHESEDETPEAVTKKITPEKPTGKQKNKKKRKSQRKVDESEDEDVLLDKLAKENAEVTQQSTSGEFFFNSLEPVFKVDPKKFDPRAELKAALGKAFKEASSTQAKGKNTTKIAGRIVKCGRAWPLVRNIGLSMVPVNDEKTEFKYVFNKHYEMLERMALMGERSMDIATAQEILHSEHWHLHSLLLLANACLMQDDITLAMDYVERGIFFCEQNFHSLYDYTNLNVSIKYSVYENRAYYLLLHKYMLMSIQKRCFETALNFAKLICSLDIQNDPLAMFLVLDTLAIKAKQYTWLNMLCRAYSENRKMNLLPNFSYSKALSAFLTATNAEQKEDANILLEDAIHKFPGVITHLIEVLQIQADATVENNSFLNIFAFNREHEGFQLVVKIYIHQSQELWKAPEVLLWLEEVSRKVATESNDANGKVAHKMDTWKEKRSKMFIGIPEEVSRLSVLLGVSNGAMSVTDPFPPSGTVNRYLQEAQIEFADENILAGFLNSMLPDYDPTIPLIERLQSLAGDGLLSRVTEFLRPHQNTEANADNANNGENNQ